MYQFVFMLKKNIRKYYIQYELYEEILGVYFWFVFHE